MHNGKNGRDCQRCHSETGWDEIRFDHNQDTDFALKGKHQTTQCGACHRNQDFEKSPGSECVDCHRHDDEHLGKNGKQCESCHSEKTWQTVSFDHQRDAGFRLKGEHAKAECGACHLGDLYDQEVTKVCSECHASQDIHEGDLGNQCDRCHNEKSWGGEVLFDHDLTDFPLLGLHSAAPCEACHVDGSMKEIPFQCSACHLAEDEHKGSLGNGCHQCHNPNDWGVWQFDHDAQTDFKLDGSHEGLACDACHTRPVTERVSQSSACASCHHADDSHDGSFGKYCDRCHTTEKFDELSGFISPLSGKKLRRTPGGLAMNKRMNLCPKNPTPIGQLLLC